MKNTTRNTTITLLAGLAGFALTAAAQAGDSYSAKGGKGIIPAPETCLWTWFAGGSVGYLTDAHEEMYTLHAGVEYRSTPNSRASHAMYLEVGFTNPEESKFRNLPGPRSGVFKTDVDIIPLTVNYKYESALTDRLNWYVGAGGGVAFTDANVKLTRTLSGNVNKDRADDIVYFAHVFAGMTYDVSEAFEVFLGARYIFMDDPDFNASFGRGIPADNHANDILRSSGSINNDLLVELGARFNF